VGRRFAQSSADRGRRDRIPHLLRKFLYSYLSQKKVEKRVYACPASCAAIRAIPRFNLLTLPPMICSISPPSERSARRGAVKEFSTLRPSLYVPFPWTFEFLIEERVNNRRSRHEQDCPPLSSIVPRSQPPTPSSFVSFFIPPYLRKAGNEILSGCDCPVALEYSLAFAFFSFPRCVFSFPSVSFFYCSFHSSSCMRQREPAPFG